MSKRKGALKTHQNGFTLIELMIASTILIMVMLLGTYAYSLFAQKWDKQLGNVNQALRQVKELTLVNNLLDGIVPLALFNERQDPGFYFIGNQQSLTAISLSGLVNQDEPVVFNLSLQQQNGKNVLLYREAPTTTNLILSIEQQINYQHELILLDGLKNLSFSYFGWPSFDVKSENSFNPSNRDPSTRWSAEYNGQDSRLHPEKLRLSLSLKDGQITINSQFTQYSEMLFRNFEGV
jgi:prepilin-type N-terminal cleavage/methylation domain-containing protein